jgi:HK97 gp10 family phage protein
VADDGLGELNKLIADLQHGGIITGMRGARLIRETSKAIEGTGKQFAPVRTGQTRDSIGTDLAYDGLSSTTGPTTSYAPFLERGTSKMAPHAFMGPALDRHSPDFVKGVEDLGGHLLDD